MGCFTISKAKKEMPDKSISSKRAKAPQHSPTVLPEPPQVHARSLLSAPPSFRTRLAEPTQPHDSRAFSSRARALSAPSSLDDVRGQDTLVTSDDVKEYYAPNPQPLPLPLPSPSSAVKTVPSFKKMNSCVVSLDLSGPLPLPPSSPSTNKGTLVSFSFEEISSACHNFSPEVCVSESLSSAIYRASFEDSKHDSMRLEATVSTLHPLFNRGIKEFVSEVNVLGSLQHPFLCKLIGFHAREASDQRMLVFERLFHGSLDRLLHGRSDGPPIDWNSRVKVALCAAQGLTFLHEEGPFQAMFHEFSTANIQIDKDFSAKLSGHGCISHVSETEISSSSSATANPSLKTLERGLLTPKSDMWSFGIVLLELLTGRKNLDARLRKEERNLVSWTRPYLSDDSRLSLIMDPQLKGRFPSKAARTIADIAQRCLQTDPSERPTMRAVVKCLKTIQDMKFTSRFPLQEPRSVNGKHMGRSISLNGIIHNVSKSNIPPSLMSKSSVSPNRTAFPLALPPRTCSSTLSLEDMDRQEGRRRLSSSTFRRDIVEGI